MRASWYAEALASALKGKGEKESIAIGTRFLDVVKARGHSGLLKLIPIELKKIIAREQSRSEVILVTVDEKSRTKWMHAYDHYEKEGIVPNGSARRDVIDKSIIGGFQIRSKNILIDSSYKKSLIDLYKNITSHK